MIGLQVTTIVKMDSETTKNPTTSTSSHKHAWSKFHSLVFFKVKFFCSC